MNNQLVLILPYELMEILCLKLHSFYMLNIKILEEFRFELFFLLLIRKCMIFSNIFIQTSYRRKKEN